MWGSEFGRTSFAQGVIDANVGRDHHGNNFVWWLAGGGVKPGFSYGETDDFSYNAISHPSRFTTCTRPCCIFWESITKSSPIARRAGTSG